MIEYQETNDPIPLGSVDGFSSIADHGTLRRAVRSRVDLAFSAATDNGGKGYPKIQLTALGGSEDAIEPVVCCLFLDDIQELRLLVERAAAVVRQYNATGQLPQEAPG
jgi:hypothetical protein